MSTPSPPRPPYLQATITFLKSGEHSTEAEVTVVAPPMPTSPPPLLRLPGLAKRLCFFGQGAVGEAGGTGAVDGDGRGGVGGGRGGVGGGGCGGSGEDGCWANNWGHSLYGLLFSRTEGEKREGGLQREGRKATLACCLGLATVVSLGAIGVGLAAFAAYRPSQDAGGRGGGGKGGGGGGGGNWRGVRGF